MNFEVRKIQLIQEFLKIQSEEAIERLEKILPKKRQAEGEAFSPAAQMPSRYADISL